MGNTFIGPTTVQTDNITNSDNTGAPTLPFGVITSAPLLFASGTAAAPSITFTGDTDTGLFRKAADSVGFVEGGIEVGSYSATGAWTLGPTVSTNFNGQIHSVIGSIRAGVVTSTDESAFFPIGSNVRTGASAAAQMRTETTTGLRISRTYRQQRPRPHIYGYLTISTLRPLTRLQCSRIS
jgi:hypothetical protein